LSNTRLKALLSEALGSKKKDGESPLYIGDFALIDNHSLSLVILEKYAELVPSFPTYQQYLECKKDKTFSGKAPKPDDPIFQKKEPGLNQKEQRIKNAYFYLKAKKQYDQRYTEHEKKSARSRAFTSDFDDSVRGYFSAINRAPITSDSSLYPQPLAEAERFFFTSTHKFHVDEKQREKHTYITASSGQGKSVTLETLFYHYLTANTDTAVILLDPHGDLASSCARLRPNKDNGRLVYIKPSLNRHITPTLNPFDIQNKEWDTINKASDALIEVFREVMKADGEGASFTPQMVTILKPCVSALLHMDNASFIDLIKFLDDDPSQHSVYLNYAQKVLTNPMHLDALKKDFMKDSFNPSKLSIKTKIRNLLNDDYFFNFLVGDTTLNLQTEIDRKAVIVFDLSDLTENSKNAIGRFVMASVTTLAKAQADKPYTKRTPIHLFVDECQNFISDSMKSILTETRKFRLHGTFAQQFTGQGMNTEMKEAVIGNSAIKITGNNGLKSLKTMASEMDITTDELQALTVGQFFIKSGAKPAVQVKVPMVSRDNRLTTAEWHHLITDQIERYYRPIAHQKSPPKPQHVQTQDDATQQHNKTRQPSNLKQFTNDIEPHLKPRGEHLKNPFDND